MAPRTDGAIYFEGGPDFEYYNDDVKTAGSKNKYGWTTLGDIGWLDEDGFLYLTDRKSFMIITGGVNVYPQEIENHLINHPKIMDAAVIGGPDPDMGERVIAIVQLANKVEASDALTAELISYCREELSGVKIPHQIDYIKALPRSDTGKLYKRHLKDQYWQQESQT